MFDTFVKLVIGDLEDKRKYRNMMKKVVKMPKEYNNAFHKIQKYIYCVGSNLGDSDIFFDLVELFESGISENRTINELIGQDVSKFCDEYMEAYEEYHESPRKKLNREIHDKFHKEAH